MKERTVTVKIGGRAASDKTVLARLAEEIGRLKKDMDIILVHGGGAEVSKVTKIFGLEPVFRDGVRMTSPEEMDIVDMVLAGKMNKYLVRLFNLYTAAVGLSGSDGRLFTGKCLHCGDDETTCTGSITAVNPQLIEILIESGFLPVVSSTSMDEEGLPLNINADEAALALAAALPSSDLVFISDVPGILKDEGIIPVLTRSSAEAEIAAGVIAGGMIPKVRSSLEALEAGVERIIIGEYGDTGDLEKLLAGSSGSKITAE
jgi:acetylglutamate kinase